MTNEPVSENNSKHLVARLLGALGGIIALLSLLQSNSKGSLYGYEDAVVYLVPVLVLSLIALAISRSQRVVFIFVANLILIAMHFFV